MSYNAQISGIENNKKKIEKNKAHLRLRIAQAKRLGRVLVICDVAEVNYSKYVDNNGHVCGRASVTVAAVGEVEDAARYSKCCSREDEDGQTNNERNVWISHKSMLQEMSII